MATPKLTKMYITAVTNTSVDAQSSSAINVHISYSNRAGIDPTPETHEFTSVFEGMTNGGISSQVLDLSSLGDVYTIQNVTLVITGDDMWTPKSFNVQTLDENNYANTLVTITNWQGDSLSTDPNEGVVEQPIFPYAAGVKN